MPFYLKEADILPKVAGLRSALIVPCRFCPAASLAVREKMPYIELFRRFLRTEAYELFIKDLRRRLEEEGIKSALFDSKMPHQYVACMWTSRRRRELAKRAAEFEGVVVLGCEAATETVREAIGPSDCRVIQGMEVEGIMNILPRVRFPFNVSIEVRGVCPVTMNGRAQRQEEMEAAH